MMVPLPNKDLIGKTVKTVEVLESKGWDPSGTVAANSDMEGMVITFTDGTRLELGACMGQGAGYLISAIVNP